MSNKMDFAARLILGSSSLLESNGLLKEDEELEKDILEIEDLPKEDDISEEEVTEEIPEEEIEKINSDNDEFEESITDKVFFCANCSKHFIATEDTPEPSIVCPVCNDADLIISLGSAEVALEDPENEEVSLEIEDLMDEEVPAEEEVVEEEDGDYFDEESLDEALNLLASKYIKDSKKIKTIRGQINESGDLNLKCMHGSKSFNVSFPGFKKAMKESSGSFIIKGSTTLFNNGKINCHIVREGNKLSLGKIGYGFLNESNNKKFKVRGIIG